MSNILAYGKRDPNFRNILASKSCILETGHKGICLKLLHHFSLFYSKFAFSTVLRKEYESCCFRSLITSRAMGNLCWRSSIPEYSIFPRYHGMCHFIVCISLHFNTENSKFCKDKQKTKTKTLNAPLNLGVNEIFIY